MYENLLLRLQREFVVVRNQRKGTIMATQDGGSLVRRPHFFKFLFPTPSLNLRIPPQFHTHLPSEFPKSANLLCPHAKIWNVEIHQTSSDMFFRRGWPEFVKAHDLHAGYLLLFRYNGKMDFEVKVFDTTSCLKDYSIKYCASVAPLYVEIEDSSEYEDPTLSSDESNDETQSLANSLGEKKFVDGKVKRVGNKEKRPRPQHSFQREPVVMSCEKPGYIEIEDSSKTSKVSDEIPDNYFRKKRKFSNPNGREEEVQKNTRGKKTPRLAPNSTCLDQFETILTRHMVESYCIYLPKAFCVKNGLIRNLSIFLERKLEDGKVVPGKWPAYFDCSENRIERGWRRFCKENSLRIGDKCIFQLKMVPTKQMPPDRSSVRRRKNAQCECIIKGYNLSAGFLSLPKSFCMANGLIGSKTLFLRRNIEGKPWPVKFTLRKYEGSLSAGWSKFARESGLKKGDQCNLQLVLEDTLLVNVVQKEMQSEKNWRTGVLNTTDEKERQKFQTTVRQYHLSCNYMSIPRAFCLRNELTTRRKIVLKDSTGKEWHVRFFLNGTKEGRFIGAVWRKFTSENGLRVGDECFFELVAEETMLVQVVKT